MKQNHFGKFNTNSSGSVITKRFFGEINSVLFKVKLKNVEDDSHYNYKPDVAICYNC